MRIFIKDTAAWMPAHYLFANFEYPFASGVKVFDSEVMARRHTVRRKNVYAYNQYFRLLIPSPEHFLQLNAPLSEQPLQLQESLLSKEAIAAIFMAEEKQNDWYSDETVILKRNILSAFPSTEEYIMYLTKIISGNQPSRTVSYLACFGVAGLVLPPSGSGSGDAFLVFDARQNIIIKEIKRELIPHTLLIS
jgi:hypothetical protein